MLKGGNPGDAKKEQLLVEMLRNVKGAARMAGQESIRDKKG